MISVAPNPIALFLIFSAIFFPFYQDPKFRQDGTLALFMPTMIIASIASIAYFIAAIVLRRRYLNFERKLKKHTNELTIRAAIADEQGLSPITSDSVVVPLNQSQVSKINQGSTYVAPQAAETAGNPAVGENLVASRIENLESKFGDLVDQLRLIAQQQLEMSQLGRQEMQPYPSSSSSSSVAHSKIEEDSGAKDQPAPVGENHESVPLRQQREEPDQPFLDDLQFPVGSTSYLL
jgi:hypothetical protein